MPCFRRHVTSVSTSGVSSPPPSTTSVSAGRSNGPRALRPPPPGSSVSSRFGIGPLIRLKSLSLPTLHKVFSLPSQPIVALFLKMRKLQTEENCAYFFSNFSKTEKLNQDLNDFFSEAQILTPLRQLLYYPSFGRDCLNPPLPEPEQVRSSAPPHCRPHSQPPRAL